MNSANKIDLLFSKIRHLIEKNTTNEQVKSETLIALFELQNAFNTIFFAKKYSDLLKIVSKDSIVFDRMASQLSVLAKINSGF